MQTTSMIDAKEAFTLSWKEMVTLYEYLEEICINKGAFNLFERLQNELKPRDIEEG